MHNDVKGNFTVIHETFAHLHIDNYCVLVSTRTCENESKGSRNSCPARVCPIKRGKRFVPKKLRKIVNLIRYGYGILRKNLFCIGTSTFFHLVKLFVPSSSLKVDLS